MDIFLNDIGELSCEKPGPLITVADLADAVNRFCHANINCSTCTNTCCSGLCVYADNIFFRNLSERASRTLSDSDTLDLILSVLKLDFTMRWTVTPNRSGTCRFLSHKNRCLIYEARPLVCRLHTCLKCSPEFQDLKNNLYYAYREALKTEIQPLLPKGTLSLISNNVTNPVLGMSNYNTRIRDILLWSKGI